MGRTFVYQRGGILGVARILKDYGNATDFDLMTRCGVRLRNVPESIGWDGVLVFMNHAPRDGALARAYDNRAQWGVTDYLLAALVDEVNVLIYQLSGGKGKKPKPVKRPQQKTQNTQNADYTRAVSTDALNARVAMIREKRS